ncbi:hypothetical protein ACI3KS_17115 [Microbacterium sp. ZW T5_45]|uniref:hypothetical protein n=1 Tax=Microbacterium sp. ZW T5_45 TaxID=3378080 RepID=UPI00385282AF
MTIAIARPRSPSATIAAAAAVATAVSTPAPAPVMTRKVRKISAPRGNCGDEVAEVEDAERDQDRAAGVSTDQSR